MLRLGGKHQAVSETSAAIAERAQLEVTALYEERGEEFLHYALALGRDEELARDALQECFMRYFAALCAGQEIAAPRAWMYRVMHNFVLDRMKEARSGNGHRLRPTASWRQNDIEGECFRHEVLRLIRSVLTAREYDCLRLRTEGMRYDEIAATLHLASGTVGALVYRATRKLRKIMIPERSKA